MAFENGSQIHVFAKSDRDHLRRRVRDEADAAVSAKSVKSTLIHAALATAYAEHCAADNDRIVASGRAWVEQHRLW